MNPLVWHGCQEIQPPGHGAEFRAHLRVSTSALVNSKHGNNEGDDDIFSVSEHSDGGGLCVAIN